MLIIYESFRVSWIVKCYISVILSSCKFEEFFSFFFFNGRGIRAFGSLIPEHSIYGEKVVARTRLPRNIISSNYRKSEIAKLPRIADCRTAFCLPFGSARGQIGQTFLSFARFLFLVPFFSIPHLRPSSFSSPKVQTMLHAMSK